MKILEIALLFIIPLDLVHLHHLVCDGVCSYRTSEGILELPVYFLHYILCDLSCLQTAP